MSGTPSRTDAAPSKARLHYLKGDLVPSSRFRQERTAACAFEQYLRDPEGEFASLLKALQKPAQRTVVVSAARGDPSPTFRRGQAPQDSSTCFTQKNFRSGGIAPGSSGLEVLATSIKVIFQVNTFFGHYLRFTTTSLAVDDVPQPFSENILPCPPPCFPDPFEPVTTKSPRARKRLQMRRVSSQLLALQLGALSFQAAGRPAAAPAAARVGAPCTAAQQRLVQGLKKVDRLVRVVSSLQLLGRRLRT